jgi:hypothetical protein
MYLPFPRRTKRFVFSCDLPTACWDLVGVSRPKVIYRQHAGIWWKVAQASQAKIVVDFCDEPQFSRISMFLKGREWLEEK